MNAITPAATTGTPLLGFLCIRLRSLTLGPPPFSSVNSTPAASKARRIWACASAEIARGHVSSITFPSAAKGYVGLCFLPWTGPLRLSPRRAFSSPEC
jgi:hypothetical protein